MKYLKHFLAFLFVFQIIGCKKTYVLFYGIRQPKIENYDSETKYLNSININPEEYFAFRDTLGLYRFYYKKVAVPDALFFNKDGFYIPYKSDSIDCNAGVGPFLEKLNTFSSYSFDSSFHISYLLRELVNSKSLETVKPFDQQDKHDFYVMLFWARYLGKLNKKKVTEWYKIVDDSKKDGLLIKDYVVNVDFQEFWGIEENQLPKFKY